MSEKTTFVDRLKDYVKKLEKSSKYEKYDIDGDGVVAGQTSHVADIQKLEHNLRKQRAQRRMATACLVAWCIYFCYVFVDIAELKHLPILAIFFISQVSIVSVYMGASAYMNRNGK